MFVVTGVTGNTGSVVAQTLLDAGKKVRVVVRNAEKGEPWQDKGAEVVVADLFDQAALTDALNGAEAAYLMLPPDVTHTDFLQSRFDIADNLVTAAQEAGLAHVVYLSSVGAHHAPTQTTGPIRTLAYLEERLNATELKTTTLRPGYFLENWGAVLHPIIHDHILPSFLSPLDKKIDMVATQDIGEKAAELLLTPPAGQKNVIELKGAVQYSAADVAQAFSKALKADITPISVPQEAQVQALIDAGISANVANLLVEMYENINNDFIHFTQDEAARGQVTLDAMVEKLLA